ncbi:hypothetical protein [Nitrospira sp. M1]
MILLSIIIFFISCVFGLVTPIHSEATELSTAANNLSPGKWAKLSNPPASFFRQNSSLTTLDAMGEGTWDPITRRVYFLAAARFGTNKLHVYDDATNSWREGGRIPGYPGVNWGHGYYHNAIDAGSGTLGYINLKPSVTKLYQFSIRQTISTANTWQLVSTTSNSGNVAEALVYFPERGTWVIADGTTGNIREYNPDTDKWGVITRKSSCFGPKSGAYHTFALYLPLRGELAFGGGNTSSGPLHSRWCTVNSSGTAVQRPDAPSPLHVNAGHQTGTIIAADPGSGELLVLTNKGKFHAFDFLTNRWGTVNDVGRPGKFNNSSKNIANSVVIPISTYGVVMYIKAVTSNPEVWIYKHSQGGSVPVPPSPPPAPPSPPPVPPSPLPPGNQTVAINFQPSSAETPAGFLKDDGSVFNATRGYGWSTRVNTRNRNRSSDQALDTLIHFDKGATVTWQYTLPNGQYHVSLASGDPSWPQGPHHVQVEGVTVMNNIPTKVNEFVQITNHLTTITDGQLTIRLTRPNGTSKKTILNFIRIAPAGSTPPPAPDPGPPPPKGSAVAINFQPGSAAVPAGFIKDDGAVFNASRGYGWSTRVNTHDRNYLNDQSRDTFIHFDTGNAVTWQYTLANGQYLISLASGDPSYVQGPHHIVVEGQTVINNVTTQVNEFLTITDFPVTVNDGNLTIQLTRNGGKTKTILNFVRISPAGG